MPVVSNTVDFWGIISFFDISLKKNKKLSDVLLNSAKQYTLKNNKHKDKHTSHYKKKLKGWKGPGN